MLAMVTNPDKPLQTVAGSTQTVYTVKENKITRDKYSVSIYNKTEIKAFRPVYTKRVVRSDLSTIPYGY